MTVTRNVSALFVATFSAELESSTNPLSNTTSVDHAGIADDGVTGRTGTSRIREELTKNLIVPAVVVPVALIFTRSTREPLAPAVKRVTSVPVPSRFVLAVEIVTDGDFGVPTYCG
jgi:hypothetical protein